MAKQMKQLMIMIVIIGIGLQLGWSGAVHGADNLISFDFRGADIDRVLQFISAASGLTVVKDATVTGPVTVISPAKVTIDQAVAALRSVLELRGVTIVRSDGMLKVLPVDAARKLSAVKPLDQVKANDGMVTVILPLRKLRAVDLQKELVGLFGASNASIVADERSNTLLLTDTAAHVLLIAEIIHNMEDGVKTPDNPKTREGNSLAQRVQIKVLPLYNADAATMAKELAQLLMAPVNGDTSNRLQNLANNRRNNPNLQRAITQLSQEVVGMAQANQNYDLIPNKVVADTWSNSLIISGNAEVIATVENLARSLDAAEGAGTYDYVTFVMRLENGDAVSLAAILNQITSSFSRRTLMFPRANKPKTENSANPSDPKVYDTLPTQAVWVIPEPKTNVLIITASLGVLEEIKSLVGELDQNMPSMDQPTVFVYRLQNARATDLSNLMNDLFLGSRSAYQTNSASRTTGTGSSNTSSRSSSGSSNSNSRSGSTNSAQNQAQQRAVSTIQQRTGTQINLNDMLDEYVRFVPDLPTNSLLIIAPPKLLDALKGMLAQLDVMPAQVLIEATVVEVTLTKGHEFGVNLSFDGKNNGSVNLGSISGGSGVVYNIVKSDWRAQLQALANTGQLNVLSNPRILASNNQIASLQIGDQIPYTVSSRTDTDDNTYRTYAYKNTGITLQVTPRIGESGNVYLDIFQSTSNLVPNDQQTENPTFATRDATTSVIVKDTQTLVIGGLIRDNKTETTKKVPVLGDVPLLGWAFKHTAIDTQKTEMLIFITPHIIRTPEEASALTATYQNGVEAAEGQSRK